MAKNTSESARLPAGDQRAHVLALLRSRKMARSMHTYTRGTAERFYAWVANRRPGALPDGPAVWICGDCHLGNLGPVAAKTGEVAVQIRDLDQSVIGNPAHDLLRLGFSLATVARSSDLPGIITWRMIEALVDGYEQAFDSRRREEISNVQRPTAVKISMKAALHRSWRKLDRQTKLMPLDLKPEAERLSEDDAVKVARYLALVVGRAHATQMDGAAQRAWRAELRRQRPKTVDAPSWLWRSIIELMAAHEEAYLDHCRRHVLGKTVR